MIEEERLMDEKKVWGKMNGLKWEIKDIMKKKDIR